MGVEECRKKEVLAMAEVEKIVGVVQYNLKQFEDIMFWSFCLANNYFCPSVLPLVTVPLEEPSIEQKEREQPESPQQFLWLTAEDHLKAGYEKSKTPWGEEEDQRLLHLRDKMGLDWEEIAEQLPQRNAKMCYSRYKRLEYNPRSHWKKSENELLKELVEKQQGDWTTISSFFKNRTPKQVKDHYQNYLRDSITKESWTLEEDMKLVHLLNQHGRNWKAIEELMQGRTQNQIKNRFFGRIKKLNDRKKEVCDQRLTATEL